jgi:hypothetical protein
VEILIDANGWQSMNYESDGKMGSYVDYENRKPVKWENLKSR